MDKVSFFWGLWKANSQWSDFVQVFIPLPQSCMSSANDFRQHMPTEGAFQLHPSWNHLCVPHSEAAAGFALSHKPALQLNTLHSKYFTDCSQQLWVCILTIRPPCWECTSSLEQAELFLCIAHLFLIFFCLISNHFWKSFRQLLNTSLSVAGMLPAQQDWMQMLGWRKNADSIWALFSLDTRGRRRKG